MASKEVPDLTHNGGLDLATTEIHVVTNVVRDGGGNLVSHGDSRRATVGELLALVAGVSFASAAEIRAGTAAAKAVAPNNLHVAAAPQALVDGANIAWDMANALNAKVTLGGNRTFNAPTNAKVGDSYALEVIQDATGNRVPVWDAAFDWGLAGAPTLSTAAGKRDIVFLYCYDATVGAPKFRASFNKSA